MKSEVKIETEQPESLKQVLDQSLETNEPIKHRSTQNRESVKVNTETETVGQLRGCTDTVFRLATLSKKILER
ncbi:MAG: hypothetical protein BRC29_02940 [Nanohaloarchaea archaeon SW_7_43_1]|nr:MAG: hypothetical protein BRC29_02940 [Nanohaloarchaea archaeon SW_7_43_1]